MSIAQRDELAEELPPERRQEPEPRFLSPFDVPTPEGAEGWEEMYPYYTLFAPELREREEGRFWFYNGMHFPEPMPAFDLITAEAGYFAIGQYQSRVFNVPTVLGIEHRVLNGYVYITANAVTDPTVVAERIEVFQRRVGYYYDHWDELLENWQRKVDETIRDLSELVVPGLPELEDESMVLAGEGLGSSYKLLCAFDRCIEGYYKINQLHFELLLLGFGAYLTFFEFCQKAFPDIDEQTITRMVSGVDSTMFQADEQLKQLAQLAIDEGVGDEFFGNRSVEEVLGRLSRSEAGKRWLDELESRKDPWFQMSSGDGFYHHHRSWADDLRLPFAAITDYLWRLRRGEDLRRPTERLLSERERIASEFAELLPADSDRGAFHELLNLARKVFPHVESHKFYCEHWCTTVFFNKVREFGRLLHAHGFLADPEDLFYLHANEVREALSDASLAWSGGGVGRGTAYWPPIVERRRRILARLAEWTPPPALGPVPETIEDPTLRMLWGITADKLRAWANGGTGGARNELRGYPASPGVVEGVARVIRRVEDISLVQSGEILVCPVTAPSWAPVFPKIAAAVSDIGGMMSHAAIVAREYGLPAVVGTGHGTKVLKTGQRVRVDGGSGVVTILD